MEPQPLLPSRLCDKLAPACYKAAVTGKHHVHHDLRTEAYIGSSQIMATLDGLTKISPEMDSEAQRVCFTGLQLWWKNVANVR